MIRHVDYVGHEIRQNLTSREILKDIWKGFLYIVAQKDIFSFDNGYNGKSFLGNADLFIAF